MIRTQLQHPEFKNLALQEVFATAAAEHSNEEHADIVKALGAKDEALAVRLMNEHLEHVEAGLTFDRKLPTNDISMALS